MKVVVNRCYGGFGLSMEAEKLYGIKTGRKFYFFEDEGFGDDAKLVPIQGDKTKYGYWFTFSIKDPNVIIKEERYSEKYYFHRYMIKRTDKILIEVIEELGDKASGRFAKLEIVEIPDNINWEIDDYDGYETIIEAHKNW